MTFIDRNVCLDAGHDQKNSAYWYFYGTRLYREDYVENPQKKKSRSKDKRRKKRKVEDEEDLEDNRESVWQVVCFTQQDWSRLVDKFRDSVRFTIKIFMPHLVSYKVIVER